MSVSAIFIMDGEAMISYGVFFYGGQYVPATPSSLDWLMGEIFSAPATTETPVIGFRAGAFTPPTTTTQPLTR
jgi:hypothetical protein